MEAVEATTPVERISADLGKTMARITQEAGRAEQNFKAERTKQVASLEKADGNVLPEVDAVMERTEVQAAAARRQLDGLMDLLKRLREGGNDRGKHDEQALAIAEILENLTTTDGEQTGAKGEKVIKGVIGKVLEGAVVSVAGKRGATAMELSRQVLSEYKKQTPDEKAEAEMKKEIEEKVQVEADALAKKLGKKLAPILGETGGRIVMEVAKKQTRSWMAKIKEKGEQFVTNILASAVCAIHDTESMKTVRRVWGTLPQWLQETIVGVGYGGETVRYSMIPILKDIQSWAGLAVQTGLLDMEGVQSGVEASQTIKASQKREVRIFNTVLKIFGTAHGVNPKSCKKLSAFVNVGVNTRHSIADGVREKVLAYRAAQTKANNHEALAA